MKLSLFEAKHILQVIDYCRENRYHGILADSAVYMIFQPPSLYSAGSMKLKFSGRIEVLRINVDKMARCLDLNPNRFCLFAALLGERGIAAMLSFHLRLSPCFRLDLCSLHLVFRAMSKR